MRTWSHRYTPSHERLVHLIECDGERVAEVPCWSAGTAEIAQFIVDACNQAEQRAAGPILATAVDSDGQQHVFRNGKWNEVSETVGRGPAARREFAHFGDEVGVLGDMEARLLTLRQEAGGHLSV